MLHFILALLLTTGIPGTTPAVKSYQAMGPSMEPAIHQGDRLGVDTEYYQTNAFRRGDLVLFPVGEDKIYFKRIIALGGERVRVDGDDVYINGTKLDEPYLADGLKRAAELGSPYNVRDFAEAVVPKGAVFVMGDNRSNSMDSRDAVVGFVPYASILGRVVTVQHTDE
ncbi:signal peptidase I [Paenibacillus mucilaginosus]|uniref:signal peptidase I n=1 Tax=Paenibacillus mucilaginosus TaxID=61624 RepID=UPI003D2065C5